MRAFAGESQARNRYTIAAHTAKEQNQYLLSQVFLFTANQEKEHAARLWKMMAGVTGQNIQIEGGYPGRDLLDLVTLLQSSVHNEMEEAEPFYPAFAETARKEGFAREADFFTRLSKVEKEHAERFKRFADLLSQQKLFSGGVQGWICLNCGYIHKGDSAPQVCPLRTSPGVLHPHRPLPFSGGEAPLRGYIEAKKPAAGPPPEKSQKFS